MPGLVGIIAARPQPGIANALDRMIASVRHFPWYVSRRYVAPDETLAIAHVSLGIHPVQHSPNRWLHGETFDSFTAVEYQPGAQRLVITNDRFGGMPLFYTQVGDSLIFGNEMKAVLAHPAVSTRLHAQGVADLVTFGFVLGERTIVPDVHCLPGGARLVFDAAGSQLKVERTWDIRQQLGRAGRFRPALLAEIAERFREAVERHTGGGYQLGVSLSGGFDSRTLLATIDHQRHRVLTLTGDVEGGGDQQIAAEISRLTNGLANHHFHNTAEVYLADWLARVHHVVWLTDGMYYDEACVMTASLDRLRELGVEVLLRGHGGELARMQWAYEFSCGRRVLACRSQAALKEQLFRQLCIGVSGELAEQVFQPAWAAAIREGARASLETAFRGVEPDWHVVDQATCLFAQEYLRRHSAVSLAQLRSRVEVRMPYLDGAYVDAVLQLPPRFRIGTCVHRYLLARANPALLRITNCNTGAPAGAPDWLQTVIRKGNAFLKRYLHYERIRHYVDVARWLRGPLRKPVETVLLSRRTADRGLLRPEGVRSLLEAHLSGHADHGTALLLLLYLEIWLRQFVDGERADLLIPARTTS